MATTKKAGRKAAAKKSAVKKSPAVKPGTFGKWQAASAVRVRKGKDGAVVVDIKPPKRTN